MAFDEPHDWSVPKEAQRAIERHHMETRGGYHALEDEETPEEIKRHYSQKWERRHISGQPSNSFRPQRERHHNEVEITFYCARERLAEMMEYRHIFGDTDFTRSLSRFLTAGTHWMASHQDEVGAARVMAREVENLEQQKRSLQETIKRLTLPAPRPWWKRWIGC